MTILERDEQNYERGKREGIDLGREEGIDLGREEGRSEGIDLGRSEGIQALIADNLEEGIPNERIIEKLKLRFDLTQEKAAAYFCEISE